MLDNTRLTVLPTAEFKFEAHGVPTAWRVRAFTLRESLGGAYAARIDLINDQAEADFESLAGASCVLTISRGPIVTRRVRGLVRHAMLDGWDAAGHMMASVDLVPAFDFLGLGRDLRWFCGKTVPEILKAVLTDGLARYDREVELGQLYRVNDSREEDHAYAARDTCAQYHESDLAFATRLMEDEGITAFFDHSGHAEKLVLVDDTGALPRLHNHVPLRLIPTAGRGHSFEALASFRIKTNPTPQKLILKDHDLTRPNLPLTATARQPDRADSVHTPQPYSRETQYRFPAGATFTRLGPDDKAYRGSDLEVRSRLLFEESQAMARVGSGTGDVSGFAPGYTFILESGHSQIDGPYLLTRVVHHGLTTDSSEAAGDPSSRMNQRYWNEFECIPLATQYRPPRRTPKPLGHLDRAIIAGPSETDDIHTEKRGYVRVAFIGDRVAHASAEPLDQRSAWIPVAQGWLGAGMGQRIIPRKGMEVLVGYQEGDIDRPVALACLPTGVNAVPYDLPDHKTRSVFFRSASTPAGNPNFSELSVDDARDHEEVFLRAARDLKKDVLHDQKATIKNDERRDVGANQQIEIGESRKLTVGANNTTLVHGDQKLIIDGNATTAVDKHERHTVKEGRDTEVTGVDSTTVHGDRRAVIEGDDLVEVVKNRTVRVNQTLTVTQGPTSVEWAKGHVDLNAGSWIRIRHASASIHIDESGKVTIATAKDVEVKASAINLLADNIAIEATKELKLSAGSGAVKLDAEGAAISGNKVSSAGIVMNEITALMVKVN